MTRCNKPYLHSNCDVLVGYDFSALQCGNGRTDIRHAQDHDVFGGSLSRCTGATHNVFALSAKNKTRSNQLLRTYPDAIEGNSFFRRSRYSSDIAIKIDAETTIGNEPEDHSPCGDDTFKRHEGHKVDGRTCSGPNIVNQKMKFKTIKGHSIAQNYSNPVDGPPETALVWENPSNHTQVQILSIAENSPCSYGNVIMRHQDHCKTPCPGPQPIYCDGDLY